MQRAKASSQIMQLNWLRAAAAIMVVACHCQSTLSLPKYFNEDIWRFLRPGAAGVQLFFVISGFVIYLAHRRDKPGTFSEIKTFALKRFKRIYPSLWIVLIPLAAMFLYSNAFNMESIKNSIFAFLIIPVETENERLLSVEWTLSHEILFYFVFTFFIWNRVIGSVLIFVWAILGTAIAMQFSGPWWFEFLLNTNHVLFVAGMLVAWLYTQNIRYQAHLALVLGSVIFFGTWAMVYLHLIPSIDQQILLYGIGAALAVYGFCSIPTLNVRIVPLEIAGAASYSLYLIHFPLVSILTKLFVETDKIIDLPNQTYFVLIVIICQLAGIAFHYLVEKPSISFVSARTRKFEKKPLQAV